MLPRLASIPCSTALKQYTNYSRFGGFDFYASSKTNGKTKTN